MLFRSPAYFCFPVTIKGIHKYKLNEIDEVREDILGAGKNEWTTRESWPYIKDLFERTWGITIGEYNKSNENFPFPGVQGYTALNREWYSAKLFTTTGGPCT